MFHVSGCSEGLFFRDFPSACAVVISIRLAADIVASSHHLRVYTYIPTLFLFRDTQNL